MNDAGFWDLLGKLDWQHEGDDDRVIEPVVRLVAALPDGEISSFQGILAARLFALDGRAWARDSGSEIWLGEPDKVSIDGFLYARCAVVARGRAVYEAVLADPSRMPKNAGFESLLYLASTAYERKTGLEWDDLDDTEVSSETFSNETGWP